MITMTDRSERDDFLQMPFKRSWAGTALCSFFAMVLIALAATAVQAQTARLANDHLKRGIARYKEGDLDGAIADLTRALEINSYSTKTIGRNQVWRIAEDQQKTVGDGTVVVDGFNALVYYNRGVVWLAKNEFDSALTDFNFAIRINPRYVDAYILRGRIKHSGGDNAGAIIDFNRAIALEPRSAFAYNNRGIVMQATGDIAGAIGDFNRAIECNSSLFEVYSNRGAARSLIGDLDGAIADLEKAASLNPSSAMVLNNRGQIHQLRGNIEKAISDFDRAILLAPDYAGAYLNRGLARLLGGKRIEAEADFKRAVALDPRLEATIADIQKLN